MLELITETDGLDGLEERVGLYVQLLETIIAVSPFDRLVGAVVRMQVSFVFPPNLRILTSVPCSLYFCCTHTVKTCEVSIVCVSLGIGGATVLEPDANC